MSPNREEAGIRIQSVQLIISVLFILGAIFGSWLNVNARIAILETKQADDETFRVEVRTYFKDLSEGQTKILIEMQNKKNRTE